MYEANEILCKGIWFGEIPENTTKSELWEKANKNENEREKLLCIIDLLKLGEFSAKEILVKMINNSNDEAVINLGIRVFCSVSNHEDISKIENLNFLSYASEDAINTFAVWAEHALSYEVVPYLLALLEEWEDTSVESTIRDSLKHILNYEGLLSEDSSVDEIGEVYISEQEKLDGEQYYYNSKPIFPGDFTKILLDGSAISMSSGNELKMVTIPTLLSIWSGIKCPVEYYTIVNDELMNQVFNYVKKLSQMSWEEGCKYFYGYKI
ncbi:MULTISPECIES: Imm47 family immunity protein [unclassified Clostridium]|uniref:Imm47 family immunity protein n=1 Tax=unclassified Clostridium TaxID=2614128 RepID=UPI0002975000|nr:MULTISPECIES: Imm47 family immunity protein [unclassified Clostridium]EKQ50967.1 MAG: hypothetical protein A370_05249 [Clostridium sp. Maddingley MBC34-26]